MEPILSVAIVSQRSQFMTCGQGDRMLLLKKSPKLEPEPYSAKFNHNFFSEIKLPQNFGLLCKFHKFVQK
jgi:hypothetical protein